MVKKWNSWRNEWQQDVKYFSIQVKLSWISKKERSCECLLFTDNFIWYAKCEGADMSIGLYAWPEETYFIITERIKIEDYLTALGNSQFMHKN